MCMFFNFAVIGFVAAISAEIRTGESVFGQMVSGGFVSMLLVIAVVTAASFAPAIRQVRGHYYIQPLELKKTS